jgi:antimicrobial peptide system SdpB family protein
VFDIRRMLQNLGRDMLKRFDTVSPWTNVYGLARTILASATALALGLNPAWAIFRAGAGETGAAGCDGIAGHLSLFCFVPTGMLDVARFVAVVILLVVASGYRPRFTAPLHWWVAFSFYASGRVTDGGEQAAAILTLLILPLALTDGRKWHWQVAAQPSPVRSELDAVARLIAFFAAWAIQIQVAYIYIDAVVEKLKVPEWLDGTVMYYVLGNNYFGAPHYLSSLLGPLTHSPFVVFLTWPSMLLEFSLGVNFLMRPNARRVVFIAAVAFHVAIAVCIGIPTFAAIMIGALLLGVVPIGWTLRDVFPWKTPQLNPVRMRSAAPGASIASLRLNKN